jgi:hypothetical protein
MGKLKEKLLNNLTEDELDDMFGVSSFDYVEYMEKYKKWQQLSLFDDNGDLISDDVLEQMYNERETAELEYYEQSELDEINDSIKLKYSDSDVIQAIKSVKDEQWFINRIMKELNGIWADKNGFE